MNLKKFMKGVLLSLVMACLLPVSLTSRTARAFDFGIEGSSLTSVFSYVESLFDLNRATRLISTTKSVGYDNVRIPTTMIRGLTGDRRLLFTALPLDLSLPGLPAPQPQGPDVVAIDRATGEIVGHLPMPPSGFRLPFSLRVTGPGRLALLDPGGFPTGNGRDDTNIAPILTEYSYSYDHVSKSFSSLILRSTAAPLQLPDSPIPFGFCSDLVALSDGTIVIAEQAMGALYAWHPDNSLELLVGPSSASIADAIPEMTSDSFQAGYTFYMPETPNSRPFTFNGDYAPGINYLAQRDGYIYWPHELTQSVYRIPVAALFDENTPWDRAGAIERVWTNPEASLPPPFGPKFLLMAGVTFNQFDSGDHHLYITMFSQARVARLDTDQVDAPLEEVLADATLFQGPTNPAFLEPRFGFGAAPLYVLSDQEYELPPLNPKVLVPEFSDWIITKIFLND